MPGSPPAFPIWGQSHVHKSMPPYRVIDKNLFSMSEMIYVARVAAACEITLEKGRTERDGWPREGKCPFGGKIPDL